MVSTYKLRDFVVKMAGGATPKTTEYDKYYCNADRGIPFIRVQNLSPEGLQLGDCKYINEETHKGVLARSKVNEDDLLVKITGVGRMAISSVAPKGFEGNINQHMVVIKTKDLNTSQLIANFLNSDIGEKLASRRSTGGTRPALDYTALRSIPVILNEQAIKIMENAYKVKQQKFKEARDLSSSINDYILEELAIVMPEAEENTLENRMSYVTSTDVIGGRFDPFYNSKLYVKLENELKNKKYDKYNLTSLVHVESGVVYSANDESEDGHAILRANNINLINNELDFNDIRYINKDIKISDSKKLYKNDILMCTASGSKEHAGKVAFISDNMNFFFGGFMSVLRVSNSKCDPQYLFEYLASCIFRTLIFRHLGGTNINNIGFNLLQKIIVVLPDIDTQKEIAKCIGKIRARAKQLEEDAINEINKAKVQAEKVLLGGDVI